MEVETMEQITPRLRRGGDFYELDGEPIRRVVGRPPPPRHPLDLLWELNEGWLEIMGGQWPEDADDATADEPVRRTVGKAHRR